MPDLPFEFAKKNHPLAPATLYNVGGCADLALLPRSPDEVVQAYEWLAKQPGPKLVLGGGSNVLITDKGFPGVVLFTTELQRIEALGDDRYLVESGVELDRMLREAMLPKNYKGTGALTGIPGSVGGAIFMNAGTVNGSTCELMESVDIVTMGRGRETVKMDPSLYSYRGQTFCPPLGFILLGIFQFTEAEDDQSAIYDHYMERRKHTQPQGHSCGSVFKNPPDNHAGKLIEACGLKGTRRGDAVVSTMHANFIMNEGNARFEDILDLIGLCKKKVSEKFGIVLEEEVRVIDPFAAP